MKHALRRWVLGLAVAAGCGSLVALHHVSVAAPNGSAAAAEPVDQVASVDQLKSQAFKALRDGHFDVTNQLLAKAASISHDPGLEKMADWTSHFESQRVKFASERHKEFEQEFDKVKLLLKHDKADYAIDAADKSYLLSDDKKAFRADPVVNGLIKAEVQRAEQYEKSEQWIKTLRIYSDMATLEPASAEWKDKLKLATRRVRLLAMYTPDVLKSLQESEAKERDEVAAILSPTTKLTTKPTTEPSADNDTFKTDWHDTLRGIRMDMLKEALTDARKEYYRDVPTRDMAIGGLKGIRAVLTTKGLEKCFPKLADEGKRNVFLAAIDEQIGANKAADDEDAQRNALSNTLAVLPAVNRETVDLPEQVMVSEFADGAFGELDPFSNMIWPSELDEFRKSTSGEFSGVGIQIQSDEQGNLKVESPLEDSPAFKAGIRAGDTITHINGKIAQGITLNQAVKAITGPPGTTVVLTVKGPSGNVKDYTIRRETIKVASVMGYIHKPGGGWEYFVDPEQKIGYLRIKSFTKDTANELNAAIDTLKSGGAKAIIMDLRYNPGGLLTAATEVSDKFLDHGVIVKTHPDRPTDNPPTVAMAKPEDADSDLPLVVLVNQYSASASEIVSGALRDHHRAILVGERTFGKGSVQMIFPLTDRSACFKLTTSHYYLPSGRCIHREENSTEWGVDPNVTIEMTPEQMRAAIDARQEQDVLRDAANGHEPTTKPVKKDLLSSDPQLSAAILLLRLELNGAQI